MSDLEPTHPNDLQFRPIETRVFPSAASEKLDTFLGNTISALTSAGRPTPMRGMQRLAFVTQTAVSTMDARADAVADRIVAAQAKSEAAVGKFDVFASDIEKSAADIEAALGQISNGPPAT